MLYLSTFCRKMKKILQNACYIENNSYLCTVQVRNATSITMTQQTICNVKQLKFRNNEKGIKKVSR